MLTPRIWVFYDEIWDGWNWDVATETVSYRSPRYNPYDSYEEARENAIAAFIHMGGVAMRASVKIQTFNSTREYVQAQIERDKENESWES